MEILSKLGIDWKLLTAQIVNFAILLFLLQRFLYKPLLSFLDQRKEKIETGLKEAEEIKAHLAHIKKMEEEIIEQAKKDAQEIVEETMRHAESKRQAALQKTRDEIALLVTDAREKITQEKEEMMNEARTALSSLVVQATQVVLQDLSDKKISDSLVAKAFLKLKIDTKI